MYCLQQLVRVRAFADAVCDERVADEVAGWQGKAARVAETDGYCDSKPVSGVSSAGCGIPVGQMEKDFEEQYIIESDVVFCGEGPQICEGLCGE